MKKVSNGLRNKPIDRVYVVSVNQTIYFISFQRYTEWKWSISSGHLQHIW